MGDIEVELVAAAPEEGLAPLDLLDVVGEHAAALQDLELGLSEVVADRADRAHLGEEAGGQREVHRGPAEHLLALPERGLDSVKGDRSNNRERHGQGSLAAA